MLRKTGLLLAATLILLAALPAAAQSDPLLIETGFSGPRAEFSPDGTQIAVLQDTNFAIAFETVPTPGETAIHLYDAATGEMTETLLGARDFVSALLFTPDGAQVLALLANGDLLTWDATSGALLTAVRTPLLGPRGLLFWHPLTGELVAASPNVSHTSYLNVDPATGALTLLTTNIPIPTYSDFRTAQEERESRIYNDIIVVPAPHTEALAGLPLTGDEVWTVDVQGKVSLLSLGTGETQVLREGDPQPMFAITELVATESGLVGFGVSNEDTFYILDLANQERTDIPIEHSSALLSPDGEQMAQYNADSTAVLLTAIEGEKVQTLALPDGLETVRPLLRLRYSPDGSRLIAGGLRDANEQGVIVVYDL